MWIKKIFKKGWFPLSLLIFSFIIFIAFANLILPKSGEAFLVMSILGKNKRAEEYFPDNLSDVGLNTVLKWYIYIDNYCDENNDVSIRIKLLNSTLPSPDDFNAIPSPIQSFINFNFTLTDHEKLLIPFFWSLSEVRNLGDSVTITQIIVNDVISDVNVSAISGSSFRLVFELWIYNERTQIYEFSWATKQHSFCVWNQLWFNATSF